MKKTFLFLVVIASLFMLGGCNLFVEAPMLEIQGSVSMDSPLLTADGGTATVRFTTNQIWTASSSESWLSVSPSSGQAGSCSINLKSEANKSVDSRSAVVTILAGEKQVIVNISQKGCPKTELTLSLYTLELGNKAVNKSVEVKSNGNWSVSSDSDWCKVNPASGEGEGAFFISVTENEAVQERRALVTVVAGEGNNTATKTVAIVQGGGEEVFALDKTEFSLDAGETEIEINVTANVDITYHVNNADWIQDVTIDSSKKTLRFKVEENTTFATRTGIIVVCTSSGQCHNVTVIQAGKEEEDVFTISQTEYNVSYESTTIEITVKASKGFTYHIQNANWIEDISTDAQGGNLQFKVAENNSESARNGIIVVCDNSGRCFNITVNQEGKPSGEEPDPDPDAPWLSRNFYHKSLAMRFTATWCGYCPRMNKAIEMAMEKKPDNIEYVAFHGNGSELEFAGTSSLMSLYGASGFPTGIMDGRAMISNYEVNLTAGLFVKVLEETEKSYPTMTSTVFSSSINGNTLTVDVELYAKQADTYKITVLLLEDGIIGHQDNYDGASTDTYNHSSIAREAITGIRGETVTVSDPKKIWKKSYSIAIPSECNKDNLRILVYVQRPYGSQQIVQGVSNVNYGNFDGYYVDNANSEKVGVKTELVYLKGGNEHIGVGEPIGTARR